MTARPVVRDAGAGDLAAIVALLNAGLTTTTHEYTEHPHTVEARTEWFERQRRRGFPVLVAEDRDGSVVGFASYGDFRDSIARPGFRHTVEHTVHVDRSRWGGGLGRLLIGALVERAVAAGVHVMIGAIDATNEGSLGFHARLGFEEVGRLPDVARKFDRWCELVLVQRILDAPSTAPAP